MTKITESGSISQRHGSADPDPDPDPHQNVMDPQHCSWQIQCAFVYFLKQIDTFAESPQIYCKKFKSANLRSCDLRKLFAARPPLFLSLL
jgi:hypothetical protein